MRLLWVDDDGERRFIYERKLLEAHGWEIHWATDVNTAKHELATVAFDAVLLDQMLPIDSEGTPRESVWSGALLLAWIRGVVADQPIGERTADEEHVVLRSNREVPVCVISAYYDSEVDRQFRKLELPDEVIPMLPKPVSFSQLEAFLTEVEKASATRSRQ